MRRPRVQRCSEPISGSTQGASLLDLDEELSLDVDVDAPFGAAEPSDDVSDDDWGLGDDAAAASSDGGLKVGQEKFLLRAIDLI